VVSWEEVALVLGAALVGALVTVAGVMLQRHFSRQDQEDATARELRERSASIVGRLHALLLETQPDMLGINVSVRSREILDERLARWSAIRADLAALALVHPDEHFRRAADLVAVAVPNSITATGWFLSDLLNRQSHDFNARNIANANYAHARGLVDVLVEYVAGRVRGDQVSQRLDEVERACAEAEAREDA
jgi:hypothetical protein